MSPVSPVSPVSPASGPFRARFQLAAVLIAAGLLLEAVTLSWSHPFSFMVFIGVSGTLVLAGVILYLWTVVSQASGS